MDNIDRYKLIGELGRGSSGAVFKAHDTHLDRLVAIKILLPSESLGADHKRTEEMFFREGRATARLMHPGIVEVFDVFEDQETGRPCMVMEFAPGGTLASRLQPDVALPLTTALEYARQIAEALDYAHSHHFIHRDLKPANILLGENDRAKITDFGLAEFSGRVGMLMTVSIHGTPAYMPPCRIKGEKYDARSDLFSLGVIFYQMLTGRLPFAGEPPAVLYGIVNQNPIPPSQLNPALPKNYDAFIDKCMAKDPNQRTSSAREFLQELEVLRRLGPLPQSDRFAAIALSDVALPSRSVGLDDPEEKLTTCLPAQGVPGADAPHSSMGNKPDWTWRGITIRPLPALRVAALLLLSCTAVEGKVWYESIMAFRHALNSNGQSAMGASLNFSSSAELGTNANRRAASAGNSPENYFDDKQGLGNIFGGPLFPIAPGTTENALFQPGEASVGKQESSRLKARKESRAMPSLKLLTQTPRDLNPSTHAPLDSYFNKPQSSVSAQETYPEFLLRPAAKTYRPTEPLSPLDSNYHANSKPKAPAEPDQNSSRPKLVRLVLGHDLREGLLTVALDGNVVIKEKLRGKRKSFLGVRETYEGVLSRVITLPASSNFLSIEIANADGTEDLGDVAATDKLEGGLHTLRASLKSDHLRLGWEPSPQHEADATTHPLQVASHPEPEANGAK